MTSYKWILAGSLVLLVVAALQMTDFASASELAPAAYFSAARPQIITYTMNLPFVIRGAVPQSLWRFGIAKARRPITDYGSATVVPLRLGWYVDWGVTNAAPQPYNIEYVPVVGVKQGKLLTTTSALTFGPCYGCPYATPPTYTVSPPISAIQAAAVNRPGMTWVVGNEMERRDWFDCSQPLCSNGQDEMLPEEYAVAYHEIQAAIKAADPAAKIAIGGMIEFTPLRQQYLDRVWTTYSNTYSITMPVDVWNIHAFVLQEVSNENGADIPAGITDTTGAKLYSICDNKDFNNVITQTVALRTWMKGKGQQAKPLIITEYGVLYPDWVTCDGFEANLPQDFSPAEVRDKMMYPSFNYFLNHTDSALGYPADDNRLVQRWNWYSLDDDKSSCGCTRNGVTNAQDFNGNLFYSGLGANPQGLTQLGTFWTTYVAPLAPGSNKPY